jgi:Sulfotransferase family
MNEGDTFPRYLDLIAEREHVQWDEQVNFLYDEANQCLVDFVGRFETLSTDVNEIFRRLGIEAVLPHKNKSLSRPSDYRTAYDEESRRKVERLSARDLEMFGYSF